MKTSEDTEPEAARPDEEREPVEGGAEVRMGAGHVQAAWTGPRPFIPRAQAAAALQEELGRALSPSGGRVVFVTGGAGCGKSGLMARFEREARRRHWRMRSAYVDAGSEQRGRVWQTAPVRLTVEHRVGRSLKRSGGQWLGLLPVVGDVIEAVTETIATLRRGPRDERRERWEKTAERLRLQGVRALLELGPRDPRLLVLDDLDRGTAEDLAGASFLIGRIAETRTLLVIVHSEGDAMGDVAIDGLIRQAERAGVGRTIRLPYVDHRDTAELLARATRGRPSPRWTEWFMGRTGGNLREIWSLLVELERVGFILRRRRSWEWRRFPPDGSGLPAAHEVERRIELPEADLDFLSTAAAQGQRFLATVMARDAGVDELEIEDRLAGYVRSGVLVFEGEESSGGELSSVYRFRQAGVDAWLRARPGSGGEERSDAASHASSDRGPRDGGAARTR